VASGKKTSIILWTGIAAAATGILAVAAIVKWRERAAVTTVTATRLRDAQEVLADCYRKIHEIEEHLPGALAVTARSSHSARTVRRTVTNGNPVLES
jgi:hypothetical protein